MLLFTKNIIDDEIIYITLKCILLRFLKKKVK